ncbi:MAG: hypothetical protein KF690_02575 [Bacteroidetes bacterium]|nr:hypothetical protein [Bacteroidota bacterium]
MKALLLLLLLGMSVLHAQTEKVIVVQMDPTAAVSARESWQSKWNGARVEYQLPQDHPLYKADSYLASQKPLFSTDCLDPVLESCFQPEMKMIFAHYTYVFGNHRGHIVKFRNTAPFTPGSKLVAQDFIFTETSLKAVNQLRDELFPKSYATFFKQQGITALVPESAIYLAHLTPSNPPAVTGGQTPATTSGTTTAIAPPATTTETSTPGGEVDDFDDYGDMDLNFDEELNLEADGPDLTVEEATKTSKEEKEALKQLESLDISLDDGFSLDTEEFELGEEEEEFDMDFDEDLDLDFDF